MGLLDNYFNHKQIVSSQVSKFGTIEKVIGLVAGAFFAYALLPVIRTGLTSLSDQVWNFAINTGPKVAIGAAAVGLFVRIIPWFKDHGRKMITEGAICVFGLSILAPAFNWLHGGEVEPVAQQTQGSAPTLLMGVVQAGADLLHTITSSFHGSLGG